MASSNKPEFGYGLGLSEIFRQDHFLLRAFIFLICMTSGGAVLTEVYGAAPLGKVVWFAAIPTYIILIIFWFALYRGPRSQISDAIAIGAIGGFLGVIAYDVARIPFVFAGYRIFAQNSSYGLWILDAEFSTRYSLVAGWMYHFLNGTLFGIMYAIFLRGRHWLWAIIWAFLLETIALVSPYGPIYHITRSNLLVIVAYYGHVAYALPLGLMVYHWDKTAAWLRNMSGTLKIATGVVFLAAIIGPLISPNQIDADAKAQAGVFQVEGKILTPQWQRLDQVGSVRIANSCERAVSVLLNGEPTLELEPCETGEIEIPSPGIHLVALPAEGLRTISSFILTEPVSETPELKVD